jgi:hypothetical protein
MLSFPAISTAQESVVAVFPFEAVNATESTAQASAMAFATELENRGYSVVDVGAIAERVNAYSTLETDEAPPPPEAEETEEVVTSDNPEVEAAQPPMHAETGMELSSIQASIAQEIGVDIYFTGTLVQLGQQIQVQINLHTPDGQVVVAKKMLAQSENNLPSVLSRLATALLPESRPPVQPPAVAQPSVVSPAEPLPPEPRRRRRDSGIKKNFGVMLGQAFGISESMHTYTALMFDGRFEIKQLMIELNAGIAFGNDDFPSGTHFGLDLAFLGYLTKTSVAPYLGAGGGMYIGKRLDIELSCPDDGDCYDEDSSAVGWNLFPQIGLEFLRDTTMRIHIDFRYQFGFNTDVWGHGPMALAGINF